MGYSYYNENSWGDDDQTNYYDQYQQITNSLAESTPGVLIGLLLLTLVFVFALVWIKSIFQGAFIRIASEACAGSSATFGKSIDHGYTMWLKILGFRFLYGLGMFVCTILVVVLSMPVTANDTINAPLALFL